jgi:hypothetical protein
MSEEDQSADNGTKQFDPKSAIHYWAVPRENRHPFPSLSSCELASLAATLLPQCRDNARAACELAAKLIRAATIQIEIEKEADLRNDAMMGDNETNRRMWRNFGIRVEGLYSGGRLKGRPFREGKPQELYPFPISVTELSIVAGLKEDAGRKRINDYVKESIRNADQRARDLAKSKGEEPPPPLTETEETRRYKATKASMKKNGICNWDLVNVAEQWPELKRILMECREESPG